MPRSDFAPGVVWRSSPSRTGVYAQRPPSCVLACSRPLVSALCVTHGERAGPHRSAEGHRRAAGQAVPLRAHRQSRRVPAAGSTSAQAGEDLRIAVGQVGLETPAGHYKIANKAMNPAWHGPELRLGGRPRGQGDSRWRARQSVPGALAGDLRRRRHARHRRAQLDRVERLARLHPHARRGRQKLYDEVPVGTPIFIH